MKKQFLTLGLLALSAAGLQAQTRLSLYEEFSGENCGPCAAYNPGLWSLISGNTSKIMLIKYQSPIPSAGPIYNAYTTVTNARLNYYSVSFAPYGVQNGNEVTGNIASYTQSNIDASVANSAPFNITASHQWNANADSITANITIASPAAYAPTGANLVLRIALVEHLQYCTAPGTNGETEFHNVVREMYPDAAGTAIPNTWALGQTQTYSIKGAVPQRVDKSNDNVVIVAWVQDDASKNIVQAAKSSKVALTLDGALTGCAPGKLACQASGTSSASATIPLTITNTGSSTLTSATIYYKVDNGTLASKSWSGSLLPGASAATSVSVSATTGNHTVYDSISSINGSVDVNAANSVQRNPLAVRDATPVALPLAEDFEFGTPAQWLLFDANGNGKNWARKGTNGHNGSSFTLWQNNYNIASGDVNYAIMPTPATDAKALDFYYAYAQYSSENDKLEVVYSTDCGTTWTSIWSQAGAALSTHAAATTQFYPSSDADWKMASIDMSNVPSGAAIAFRATSDYGNNLFIDDVNLRGSAPAGISQLISGGDVSLYPNPAKEEATLQLNLLKAGNIAVSLQDALGRTVTTIADGNMTAGVKHLSIPTGSLSAGVYTVSVRTAEGSLTKRLSVVK